MSNISAMNADDLDLNLLRIFHQVIAERSVSRAAERLGLTQPAVSNALARLRRLCGDELFLRTPGGMVPTPRAEQLAAAIGPALDLIRDALDPRDRFEPATSPRTFTLGMTDIGEIVFLPALLDHLARTAPAARLRTVRHTAPNLREGMADGQVDVAIGLLPQLQAGFVQRRLFQQRYVALFRQGHALDRPEGLTVAGYVGAAHVAVESPGTGHGQIDELLRRAGVERQVRLTVPHFVAIGHILAASDLVATVPARLADHLAVPFGLRAAALPVALAEIPITLFWHARVHRDAANRWLREQIIGLFAAAPPTAPESVRRQDPGR